MLTYGSKVVVGTFWITREFGFGGCDCHVFFKILRVSSLCACTVKPVPQNQCFMFLQVGQMSSQTPLVFHQVLTFGSKAAAGTVLDNL